MKTMIEYFVEALEDGYALNTAITGLITERSRMIATLKERGLQEGDRTRIVKLCDNLKTARRLVTMLDETLENAVDLGNEVIHD